MVAFNPLVATPLPTPTLRNIVTQEDETFPPLPKTVLNFMALLPQPLRREPDIPSSYLVDYVVNALQTVPVPKIDPSDMTTLPLRPSVPQPPSVPTT